MTKQALRPVGRPQLPLISLSDFTTSVGARPSEFETCRRCTSVLLTQTDGLLFSTDTLVLLSPVLLTHSAVSVVCLQRHLVRTKKTARSADEFVVSAFRDPLLEEEKGRRLPQRRKRTLSATPPFFTCAASKSAPSHQERERENVPALKGGMSAGDRVTSGRTEMGPSGPYPPVGTKSFFFPLLTTSPFFSPPCTNHGIHPA